MSGWRTVLLAAGRELRVRRRTFVVSTALVVLAAAAGTWSVSLLAEDGPSTHAVGVVGTPPPGFTARLESALGPGRRLVLRRFDHVEDGEQALRDETVEALVVDGDTLVTGAATGARLEGAVAGVLESLQLEERAAELGVEGTELDRLLASQLTVRTLPAEPDAAPGDLVVAGVGIILLYMAILLYGQWVAFGVVEEKSSRVVELVLGAVRPQQLLVAKVAAIGALGLAQMVLVGATVLLVGGLVEQVEIPDATGAAFAIVVLWFLLGYTFYGTAYAAAGAVVSRAQDASNAGGPLNLLLSIGYLVGWISLPAGADNAVLRGVSYLPPFSPVTMPLRMVSGSAVWWEVVLSLALMVAATYAVLRVAGRVYVGGVVRVGRKLKWREAFRGGSDLSAARSG